MTRQIEFEGSNVEKAAMAACKELNITKDRLKYQVVSYGSTGIFGLVGTKKAKIRVQLPEEERIEAESEVKHEEKNVNAAIDDAPLNQTEDFSSKTTPEGKTEERLEALKTIGFETLQKIAGAITDDVRIEVEADPEQITYKISSENAAVMIGKRGQTLEAIQYLVEKVIHKQNQERIHVQVDVEGYLEKRRESLEGLATRMAEKATKTGRPVTIGQMSAYERRIIHLFLKGDKRVRTQSRGDGFLRKLIIFPLRSAKKRKAKAKTQATGV